jgi:hypothetical protein
MGSGIASLDIILANRSLRSVSSSGETSSGPKMDESESEVGRENDGNDRVRWGQRPNRRHER